MAAVVIPGQTRRWGNESTNFFQASYTENPGVPSRQKVYRCRGNQYTNAGHYHVGTKAVNLGQPLDRYGSAVSHRLRADDQRLPRALASPKVHMRRMSSGPTVNPYQSHQQSHHPYSMPRAPLRRSSSEDMAGADTLARSLSSAFYITSYQLDIARNAALRTRSDLNSEGTYTLRESFQARRSSISGQSLKDIPQRHRVASAPPVRSWQPPADTTHSQPQSVAPPTPAPPTLQRRRSISAVLCSYPTRGEMLRDIFTAFPAPEPQATNRRLGRPSSAVTLRSGKIPDLRRPKHMPPQAWI